MPKSRSVSLPVSIAFALVASAFVSSSAGGAEPLATDRQVRARRFATDRHVHGVITAVEPATVTIADAQRAVTGRIDPTRTKVRVHGHPAKLADLQVTAHAKAELCLDDVWLVIDAH